MSISGKPGLYKFVSYGKNLVIVESLADQKRMPAYNHDKIISLGDVAIYTDTAEVPLGDVFETIYKKFEGKNVDVKKYNTPVALKEFFAEILPDYDRERVYNNDIKKVISWYNLLVGAGLTEFSKIEEAPAEEAEATKE